MDAKTLLRMSTSLGPLAFQAFHLASLISQGLRQTHEVGTFNRFRHLLADSNLEPVRKDIAKAGEDLLKDLRRHIIEWVPEDGEN